MGPFVPLVIYTYLIPGGLSLKYSTSSLVFLAVFVLFHFVPFCHKFSSIVSQMVKLVVLIYDVVLFICIFISLRSALMCAD